MIALPLPTLCELVWVLQRGMGKPADAIAAAIRALTASPRVETDRIAVELDRRSSPNTFPACMSSVQKTEHPADRASAMMGASQNERRCSAAGTRAPSGA